jgi:hypothetical protein
MEKHVLAALKEIENGLLLPMSSKLILAAPAAELKLLHSQAPWAPPYSNE